MKHKFFNSIRHKLMVFVVLLCVLLIALVWFLNIQLLEPSYISMIKHELSRMSDTTVTLINKYNSIVSEENGILSVNPDFINELNNAISGQLTGKCIDISDRSLNYVMGSEGLSDHCLLHPSKNKIFFGSTGGTLLNSTLVRQIRNDTFNCNGGEISFTIPGERQGISQLVVGRRAGDYVVLISQDLERIGEATNVLARQMITISAVLLVVSILSAYIFSRWFTRPLTQLSCAAREMSRGNYKVRVNIKGSDEIGVLCEDFNTMAYEVSRTAQLQRDIIADISHDLRTPLTLIKGYAETVRDLTGDDKAKREDQLSIIVDETDRLSALVSSVMELSKYSSGSEKIEYADFDIAQLCDEVAYKYKDIFDKNGFTLNLELNEECLVHADANMMSRVIHNWLANAMHHVGKDGYVGIRATHSGNKIRVEIQDHGEGIAAEDLPHIFDKYYRTRASAGKIGTGLGLSISKAILINHGFSFGVKSIVNEGTTFWFET